MAKLTQCDVLSRQVRDYIELPKEPATVIVDGFKHQNIPNENNVSSMVATSTIKCEAQISNPALIKHNGEYRMYFKAAIPDPEKKPDFYNREFGYGVATSKTLEGPYEFYPDRLTSDEIELEDVYAFSYDDQVYMLSRDIAASLGSKEGGLLWVSEDGIHFPKEKTQRAFESLATYLDEGALDGAAKYRGTEKGQLERPQILLIDGEPTYLYLATGINPKEGFGSCSHVFTLNLKR